MREIIKDKVIQNKLHEIMNDADIERLEKKINSIDPSLLFASNFHGFHHSQKVLLFSYMIGKSQKFNDTEMEILMDAAIYHDIGREQDRNDDMHGYSSAFKIGQKPEKYLKNSIYDDKVNLDYLRLICEVHCLDDSKDMRIYKNYKFDNPNMHKHIFLKLARALKDADALDRTRFTSMSEASLDESFLRYKYSKTLIEFAKYVNKLYILRDVEKNYEHYKKDYGWIEGEENNYACFHGIGLDYFKLESILNNGILSSYACEKADIDMCRNFRGSNGNLWISVVDDDLIHLNGTALKKYIRMGISLYCFVPKFKEKNDEIKNFADINNKNEYEDERYVFDKIDKSQINSIIVPNNVLNRKVNEVNYLICSTNYDVMFSNVTHYIKEMKNRNFEDIDIENAIDLLGQFKLKVINFEKLNISEKQIKFDSYCHELDMIKEELNKEVQKWITKFYMFKLDTTDIPSVFDVVKSIISNYDISMIYDPNSLKETVFVIESLEINNNKSKN